MVVCGAVAEDLSWADASRGLVSSRVVACLLGPETISWVLLHVIVLLMDRASLIPCDLVHEMTGLCGQVADRWRD